MEVAFCIIIYVEHYYNIRFTMSKLRECENSVIKSQAEDEVI